MPFNSVPFGILAFFIGGWIGEWGLTFLYGKSISGYVDIFQLIIVVSTLSSISMCLNALFTAMRKLISLSVALLLGCLLCYFITPQIVETYAMRGVTYTLMIAQAFQIITACALAFLFIHQLQNSESLKNHNGGLLWK